MLKYFVLLFTFSLITQANMKKIYTFSVQTNIGEWRIVNDGVMGGISKSSLKLTDAGYGKFSGHVSLANNGGFASVQLNTDIQLAEEIRFIVLRVKGDGKRYEFRLKGSISQPESYVHPFATSGEWETIRLSIREFYPQFRGSKLNIPNFNFNSIEQLTFLIANKQEEDFDMLIDWIGLE
jgi:NADH dehydrogenase [ubiquinone] 1 alpha subcomplex assembly factor 1